MKNQTDQFEMSQTWKSTYWGTFSYREKGLHSSWAHSAPGQCLAWISSPCSALATTRRSSSISFSSSNGCGGCDRWDSRDGQIPASTSVFSSAFPRSPFPIYYAILMDLSGNPTATYTNCVQRCRIGQTGPLRTPQPILGNDGPDRLGIFRVK